MPHLPFQAISRSLQIRLQKEIYFSGVLCEQDVSLGLLRVMPTHEKGLARKKPSYRARERDGRQRQTDGCTVQDT